MKPCATKTNDCPCSDNPLTNFSSEAPDKDVFIGFNTGWGNHGPNPGETYTNPDGYSFCENPTSQEEADLCAADGQLCNQIANCDTGGPGGGGGDAGDGGNRSGSPTLYPNSEQSCTVPCPDGSHFTYRLPEGSIHDTNPVMVDRVAHSLACTRARHRKICINDIPNACLNEPYDEPITADSFDPDIDWELISGALPPGLQFEFDPLDPTLASIVGTPTVIGSYTFRLRATNSRGEFVERTFTMGVIGITNSPTPAVLGSAYSFQFTASGGTAPYTFAIPTGTLPAGLFFNELGQIIGTPTDATPKTFTVAVQDSTGRRCAIQQFTIPISSLDGYCSFDQAGDPHTDINSEWVFTNMVPGKSDFRTFLTLPAPAPVLISGKISLGIEFDNSLAPPFNSVACAGQAWDPVSQPGFTIFGWVQLIAPTNGPPGSYSLIGLSLDSGFSLPVLGLSWEPTTGRLTMASGASAVAVLTSYSFLAYTYNNANGNERCFLNGALLMSGTAPTFSPSGFPSLFVVSLPAINSLQTKTDELGFNLSQIYSQSRITALYSSGNGLTWPAANSV